MALKFSNRIHMWDDQSSVALWIEHQPELGMVEIGMDRDGVVVCAGITPEQLHALMERIAAMLHSPAIQVASDDTYPDF